MVPFRLRLVFGFAIAALMVVAPLRYRAYVNRTYRNFRVVTDGVLVRSAQLPVEGLERLIHDYRIRTIISLRDKQDAGDDRDEEALCRNVGIRFVRLPPQHWSPINGIVPAEDNIKEFLKIMDEETRHPVLIHCFAGTHRTGAYVAIYRMEYQGWTNEQAVRELRQNGYVTLDGDLDVREFLEQYQPRRQRTAIRPVSQEKAP
jgi:tyrosine-protein phosphatase SIW14